MQLDTTQEFISHVMYMACPWIAGPLPLREDSSNVEFAGVLMSCQSIGRQTKLYAKAPNDRVKPAALIGELEASYAYSDVQVPTR
jgi:hypothetical protein